MHTQDTSFCPAATPQISNWDAFYRSQVCPHFRGSTVAKNEISKASELQAAQLRQQKANLTTPTK